eukprot:TRINITY_DN7712_c0_g1_i1.p1 TRINITY_DN7712_c0_g1~~TRINITY_DN7712_c0_g1_i1.p1  ORF type:complete len:242 (+),score=14.36 TRINITY_DN7712_c0_g1_i1:89-814(+)
MASVAYFTFLKVLRDRSARDKLYKVVQYSLKVVLETAKRNKLESFLFPYFTRIVKRLGQARSLFRFLLVLGVAETFPKVATLASSNPTSITTLEAIINFISQTGCDVFDSVSCAHDVLGTGGRLRAAWWSCAFWLIGIVLAIIRHSFLLSRTAFYHITSPQEEGTQLKVESPKASPTGSQNLASISPQTKDSLITLTKALGDLGHALGILSERIGKYKLITGYCGLLGGSIGLLQSVQKLK